MSFSGGNFKTSRKSTPKAKETSYIPRNRTSFYVLKINFLLIFWEIKLFHKTSDISGESFRSSRKWKKNILRNTLVFREVELSYIFFFTLREMESPKKLFIYQEGTFWAQKKKKKKKNTLIKILPFQGREHFTPKKLKNLLYLLEITWIMLLYRGLYWFDYPKKVKVESPVNLIPFEEMIEPTLQDNNMPK